MEIKDVLPIIRQIAEAVNKDTKYCDTDEAILSSAEERAETLRRAKLNEEISSYFEDRDDLGDDIYHALGVNITEKAPTPVAQEQEVVSVDAGAPQTVTKKGHKATQKDMFKFVNENVSSSYENDCINFIKLADKIIEKINDPNLTYTSKNDYLNFANAIKEVAEKLPQKYNSKADIEAMKNMKVKFSGPMADFQKDILEHFISLAETNQKDKEFRTLQNEFKSLREALPKEAAIVEALNKNPENAELLRKYQNREITADQAIEQMDAVAKKEYSRLTTVYAREDAVTNLTSRFKTSYYSEALDRLIKTDVLEDARKEVWDAIWSCKGDRTLTTSGAIEDKIKTIINRDKYTAKIMRGELSFKDKITGERSTYKDFRKAVATYNRVENIKKKQFTQEEMYKAFKNDARFNELIRSDLKTLIVKDEKTGTYNVAALSDLIKETISPADMRANYQISSLSEHGEIYNLIENIKGKTGVTISYKDACNLIDLCGFERDKKNFGYYLAILGNTAKDAIIGTATSAATAFLVDATVGPISQDAAKLLTNYQEATQRLLELSRGVLFDPQNPVALDLKWKLNVKVNGEEQDPNVDFGDLRTQIMNQFFEQKWEDGTPKWPEGTYGFDIDEEGYYYLWIRKPSNDPYEEMRSLGQILGENFDLEKDLGLKAEAQNGDVHQGDPKVNRRRAILYGSLINLGLNALLNSLTAEMKGEQDFLNTIVQTNDINEYFRQLDVKKNLNKYPRFLAALKNVARLPVFFKEENGIAVWDNVAFSKFLQEIAGGRSFLNASEFEIGIKEMLKKHSSLNPIDNPDKPDPVDNNPQEPENGTKFRTEGPRQDYSDNVGVIMNAGRYGWQNLGEMYKKPDGQPVFAGAQAFRAMQVIQAIDPQAVEGRFDADMIKEIVSKAFPSGRGKPNWDYINNQLKSEYPMVDVARLKAVLASGVSADDTKDKKVVAPLVIFDKDGEYNRGTPERETPVKGQGNGKKPRFNVATRFTKVINGQTHYYLQPPGGSPIEVPKNKYIASKYTPID